MLNCKETQDSAVKIGGNSSDAVFSKEVPTSLETSEIIVLLCLTRGHHCFKYIAYVIKKKSAHDSKLTLDI